MALSTNESALLTETCTNMNIAANTCREVLEMLRSLGNTGVVDIATHNNAETPHENAANLVHIVSNNMVLGTYGSVASEIWNTYYPFMIRKNTTTRGYNILQLAEAHGSTSYRNDYSQRFAITDANGNMTSLSGLSASTLEFGRFVTYCHYNDGSQNTQSSFGLHFFAGETGTADPHDVRLQLGMSSAPNSYNYSYIHVFDDTSFAPYSGATVTLGVSSRPFDTAYLRTAATITSDRREKSGISAIGSEAVEFVKALRPVQFTVKNGRMRATEVKDGEPVSVETDPGVRRHWGLVAQEVQEALVSAGYDPSDCAVWSLADKDDPDSRQALRYEELIAPMIKVIQNQQERIEALERKVA